MEAAAGNPQLLNGLAVTAIIDPAKGSLQHESGRAAADIRAADGERGADAKRKRRRGWGRSIRRAKRVAEGMAAIPQNGGAKVQITGYEGDLYRATVSGGRSRRCCASRRHIPGLAGGGGRTGAARGAGGRGADGRGGSGGKSRTGGALPVLRGSRRGGDQRRGMAGGVVWLWWGFRRRESS